MKALGLAWLGVAADRFDEMVGFLTGVVGLDLGAVEEDVTILRTQRGDWVEVFRPEARYDFMTTGPVPGFLVDDAEAARAELDAAGVELLGDFGRWERHAWQHFRAPDGNVYEVTSGPYRPEGSGTGLSWVGTRTRADEEMVQFAVARLGLRLHTVESGITQFEMGNGDQLEVFALDEPDHQFMTTGPVVGFEVADVATAVDRLRAAGIELLGGTGRGTEDGRVAWQHFRAPDGNVFEVVGPP